MAGRGSDAALAQAVAYLDGHLPLAALEQLAVCAAAASRAHDPEAALRVATVTARAYAEVEYHERAVATLSEALGADAAYDAATLLPAQATLARLQLTLHRDEAALATCREALDRPGVALALGREGSAAAGPGALAAAAELWLCRAQAHTARAEWDDAGQAGARAEEAWARLGLAAGVAAARYELGWAALARSDLSGAARWLDEALAGDRGGEVAAVARDYGGLAALALARGDGQAALRHGSAALSLLWVGRLDPREVARLCRIFGRVLADAGERSAAIQCLSRAAAYYAQTGDAAAGRLASSELDALLAGGGERPTTAIDPDLRRRIHDLTTLLGLVDELASTDPHLARHASVVAGYGRALAGALGLPAEDVEALASACRLYHVGQSAGGEGPTFPVRSAQMLSAFSLPQAALDAVRHHRERWDGGGFPSGLAGEDIPLLARVLGVADGYVSLAFDPAEPLPHSAAMALLQARAGTVYDPGVAGAMVRLHEAAGGDA